MNIPGAWPIYVINTDGSGVHRITTERNSADRPLVDPLTGRIVLSRWWRNFRMATDATCVGCHAGHTMIPVPPTAEDSSQGIPTAWNWRPPPAGNTDSNTP
jgi:hypothetical protein